MASLMTSLTGEDLRYHRTVAAAVHLFYFVIFNTIRDQVCWRSLCNIFMLIFESLRAKYHNMTLSNICQKNYCINVAAKLRKESAL